MRRKTENRGGGGVLSYASLIKKKNQNTKKEIFCTELNEKNKKRSGKFINNEKRRNIEPGKESRG